MVENIRKTQKEFIKKVGGRSKMNQEYIEKLADKKMKEMFPEGFVVSGNYEGYRNAIIVGINLGIETIEGGI